MAPIELKYDEEKKNQRAWLLLVCDESHLFSCEGVLFLLEKWLFTSKSNEGKKKGAKTNRNKLIKEMTRTRQMSTQPKIYIVRFGTDDTEI
jgi:hypothetical protein